MNMDIVFWLIIPFALLVLFLGVIMMLGRGGSLLAGWNMATPEERSIYDEKKVLRVAGLTLISIGILFAIMSYLSSVGSVGIIALLVIPLLPLVIGIPLINSKYVEK